MWFFLLKGEIYCHFTRWQSSLWGNNAHTHNNVWQGLDYIISHKGTQNTSNIKVCMFVWLIIKLSRKQLFSFFNSLSTMAHNNGYKLSSWYSSVRRCVVHPLFPALFNFSSFFLFVMSKDVETPKQIFSTSEQGPIL